MPERTSVGSNAAFPHRAQRTSGIVFKGFDGSSQHGEGKNASMKLVYTDKQATESIRHTLFIASCPFKDQWVGDTEWAEYGAQGAVLEVAGYTMRHWIAILRYVGKLTNFYPDDPYLAMACDEIVYTIRDFRAEIKRTTRKTTKLKEFNMVVGDKLKEVSGKYAIGNNLSVADLELVSLWHWAQKGTIMGLPPDAFISCEKFEQIRENVLKHPKYEEAAEKYKF